MKSAFHHGLVLGLVGFACAASALFAQDDDEGLPLPRWSEEDLRAMREQPQAAPLLNNLLWPENVEFLAETEPAPADTPDARQPAADLSRFLPPHLIASPGAGRSLPSAFIPTSAASLRDVSAAFLADAAGWPPERHLIDPNGELSETMEGDFARFLEFHARDARVRLHVLLLGRDERLPGAASPVMVAQGSLQHGNACLAVVPRGEPWRLRLFLSRHVHETAPPAELAEMLEDCVRDAMLATDEDEQIHRLLVRLSIRLFWLERLLTKPAAVKEAIVRNPEPLSEVTVLPDPVPIIETRMNVPLAAGLAALLGLIFWRWRRYKLRHYVWTLPEHEVAPRLGGAHCGGGTWIDYR
jgi:hypothetical protein